MTGRIKKSLSRSLAGRQTGWLTAWLPGGPVARRAGGQLGGQAGRHQKDFSAKAKGRTKPTLSEQTHFSVKSKQVINYRRKRERELQSEEEEVKK